MRIITISRQFGSGGDEIAELICKNTGSRMFDKYLISRTAMEAGLSGQEMIDYSEESHKVKSFLERLFWRTHPVAQMSTWTEDEDGIRTREEIQLAEKDVLMLIQKAVETAYQMGRIVIVGRGGQVILKDRPGVLHVRIEAPLEDRLLRVRQGLHLAGRSFSDSVEARRAAQDLLEAQDAASADYLKRHYGVDWSDLAFYHLLINTSKLKIEQAAQVITDTARLLEPMLEQG